MARLVKPRLYKATWNLKLKRQELEEGILDKEIHFKNPPLLYIDDDVQFPVLTPNILIHGQLIAIPEEQLDDDNEGIKKQKKYIKCCKDAAWNTWSKECLGSLRERHNMKNNQKHLEITITDSSVFCR